MRDIFAQAERVLVFDSEIMASTGNAGYEELSMRVKRSRWIRRLWTAQEAALPRALIFQFSDKPQMFQTGSLLWKERLRDLDINYFNCVGSAFHVQFDHILLCTQFIWQNLIRDRAVSVKTDEPICCATLMEFDLKQLMSVKPSERMKEFWRLHQDQVPVAALFPACRRLKDKGYSWAPASLLGCPIAGCRFNEYGKITKEGLLVKFKPYTTFSIESLYGAIRRVFPCTLDGHKYFIVNNSRFGAPSIDDLVLHTRKELALVIERPTAQGQDGRWSFEGSRCVLAEILHRYDSLFYAEYLTCVRVVQEGSSFHQFPRTPWPVEDLERMATSPTIAEWFTEEYEWYFV